MDAKELLETSVDADEMRAAFGVPYGMGIEKSFGDGESRFRLKFKPVSAKDKVLEEIRAGKAQDFNSLPKGIQDKIIDANDEGFRVGIDVAAAMNPVNMADYSAKLDGLLARIAELEAKDPGNKSLMLDRLERSLGLSAANVVAMTPAAGDQKSPIDTFNEMPEGAEKSAFFKAHQPQLSQFINKPAKAS